MHILDSLLRGSRLMTVAFLLFMPIFLQAENYVLYNDDIMSEKVVSKINEIGTEFFEKDAIRAYVVAKKNIDNISLKEYAQNLSNSFENPFVLLLMLTEERVIDIINSSELDSKFNKSQILSPVPTYGTIKPLLSNKKDFNHYEVALLNGYADIVEQIAKSDKITLQSALGSTNRDLLSLIRVVVYGMIFIAFLIYIYKKVRYKNAKEE